MRLYLIVLFLFFLLYFFFEYFLLYLFEPPPGGSSNNWEFEELSNSLSTASVINLDNNRVALNIKFGFFSKYLKIIHFVY